MNFLLLALLLTGPTFRLEPGDYRYVPVSVRKTPAEVACRFDTSSGGAGVHAEFLTHRELRAFLRHKEHESIVATSELPSAAFHHIVEEAGEYDILIANSAKAAAVVALEVKIDTNFDAAVSSRELSPQRRLTVILVSFALFFAIVTWSGLRLLRCVKETR